jgi:hypothetical protein
MDGALEAGPQQLVMDDADSTADVQYNSSGA